MRLFILFVILLAGNVLSGQNISNIPVGTWRTHLPTTSSTALALNKNNVYSASSTSSFTLDQEDGHMSSLSKIDGLSESQIAVMRFNESKNTGIIGYLNGNIDFIINGKIVNFDVILRSNVAGSKKINNITLYDNLAFVSCDFGVSIIDIKKFEIKESWLNLRTNGLPNKVYGCTLNDTQDSVFLATEYGAMSAKYNKPGINLMDFTNWYVYTNISSTMVKSIASFKGSVYCGVSGIGLYVLNGTIWNNIGLTIDADDVCYNLIPTDSKLILCAQSHVYTIDNPAAYTFLSHGIDGYGYAVDAGYDHSGNLWLADTYSGLIRYNTGQYKRFAMNGPSSKSTFALYYYNNTILANAGGYNGSIQSTYNYSGFYQFENQEKWVNYYRYNSNYPNIGDNVVSAYNPYDDTVYIGHFGAGLVSWNKSDKFIIHDTSNTILVTSIITGLDVDSKGTLWMSAWICFDCDQTGGSVYSKTKKGVWTSYTLTQSYEDKYLIQLKLDQRGNKWLRYGGSGLQYGLIVFNENGNQERHFSATDGLPDAVVNCIEVDKKGVVWIGTGKGLAGFYEPSQAFTGNFIKPIYNGFPILFDKNVTCIKSDGGNRKWVGTTEGLWLFNDDFSKALSFFDVNNSPLYSNNIIALEIHELTGELFIATDEGIISYRPDASEEHTDLKSAHIFPNPVKPDYAGLIAIDGLQDNAVVKITDTQGKLFYETKATGGTATWNMVNYAGIKAESGMYLVFVSTDDGGEKYVGKIAIVQ